MKKKSIERLNGSLVDDSQITVLFFKAVGSYRITHHKVSSSYKLTCDPITVQPLRPSVAAQETLLPVLNEKLLPVSTVQMKDPFLGEP